MKGELLDSLAVIPSRPSPPAADRPSLRSAGVHLPGRRWRVPLALLTLTVGLLPPIVMPQGGSDARFADFFPMQVGDLWTYELTDSGTWARTASSLETLADGRSFHRIDESSQDYRLQQWEQDGLNLRSLHFADGTDIDYESPVLLVPTDLAVGATHRVEVSYAVVERGVPSHQGTQIFEVQRLPDRAARTPAGTFERCMVLRIRSRRESEIGTIVESTYLETRTAGIGLIGLEREAGSDGEGSWSAWLTGASVGGRLLPP